MNARFYDPIQFISDERVDHNHQEQHQKFDAMRAEA
jgi:hypothetical protein